ncbi:MFS transporter [Legionella jamestowniensis]|uniref:Proline betaine transport protein like protein n=1 Tax=Legionella jamestowniensis TaxID=455 RepID=A0A0W0UKU5_9GAMM|nr:MFS transporter [Legionella jamestowniensis]KTD08529.1 proline betaine transport protein like protein [Legionella jamestowniensis]SFL52453.1 MFS transporter, MHS family, proline/betaine transporter [Legionella jamestowniensis DSM 19215]
MAHIKDKIASSLGSVLEWYDFALYGFFSQIIIRLYFPSSSPSLGLLKAFSVFAVGFFARPIGGLLFGYIGDKYGRSASLRITPLLITIPTLIFSILPTYQRIGILAPAFLVVLRVWQGICIGGEYSNNIIYLCETSKPNKLYFWGSIGACTGSLGILIASTTATLFYHLLSYESLESWGWRIAYALSALIGIAAYILRKKMLETVVFEKVKSEFFSQNPILYSYKNDFESYLISFGLTFLPATAFYYVFMFLPSFLNEILKLEVSNVVGDNALSLFIRLLIIPIIGLLADKIGGIPIARIACIFYFIFSYPLFYGLIHTKNIYIFILSFAILTTLNAGTTPGLLINLLRPHTRSTILSISFNFSFGILGGIVPIISFLLIKKFNLMASIYYLMFAALVTFVSTFFLKGYHEFSTKGIFAHNNANNN